MNGPGIGPAHVRRAAHRRDSVGDHPNASGPNALLPDPRRTDRAESRARAARSGVLSKHGVRLIGAQVDAIRKAEDRILFKDAMTAIGLESPFLPQCAN